MGKCCIQLFGNVKRRNRRKRESREIRGEKPGQREEIGCLESGLAQSVRCQHIRSGGREAHFKGKRELRWWRRMPK